MQRRSRNHFVTEDNDDSLINLDADSRESLELSREGWWFLCWRLGTYTFRFRWLYLKCVFSSIKTPFGWDFCWFRYWIQCLRVEFSDCQKQPFLVTLSCYQHSSADGWPLGKGLILLQGFTTSPEAFLQVTKLIQRKTAKPWCELGFL